MRYFEDFEPGQQFDCGSRVVPLAEAHDFAQRFDPQPYLLAPASEGTLSGWHLGSTTMRLYYEAVLRESSSLGAPGIERLQWFAPARAGEPLSARMDVGPKRESRSRPEMGFVTLSVTTLQAGEPVMALRFPMMARRRGFDGISLRTADRTRADAAEMFASARPAEEMGFARGEDAPFGALFDLGDVSFNAPEIISFARDYDPQPFHIDEEAGRVSAFGGLAASGWHICSLWSGAWGRAWAKARAAAPQLGEGAAQLFCAPTSVSDLKWRLPALDGDRLRFFIRFIGLDPIDGSPGLAALNAECGGVNQHGALA
ncbi:MAG: hypothetical protein MRY74_07585, partial [Neomegalonema sp.]|nr:hypothetical protein [Neomegalonema sp.]